MDPDKGGVREDLIRETEHFWDDPRRVMALIDLLFLNVEKADGEIVS